MFNIIIVCVLFEVCCPSREVFTHGDRYQWRATDSDLSLILIAILRSEDSLTYYTYFDSDHLFVIVISKDPWHPRRYWAFSSGVATTQPVVARIRSYEFLHANALTDWNTTAASVTMFYKYETHVNPSLIKLMYNLNF